MGAPVLNGPFTMPMFRNFVPRKLQPWLYIFIAVTFQLSGGLYMANLSHMVGETSLMREDLQMCLYCNLAGMAVYFPLLFRMKFRFTNKTLLTAASLGVIVCNLIAPYTTFLPLLFLLYDAPVRRELKLMPSWRSLRKEAAMMFGKNNKETEKK